MADKVKFDKERSKEGHIINGNLIWDSFLENAKDS